jgi:uncharacterized OB-fold protein
MSPNTAGEPWIVEQRWDLTYQHTADAVTAGFLRTLRDEGKLTGSRCPQCHRVLAPARPICDRDFCRTDEIVELEPAGVLELFTIVHMAIDGLRDPPYVLGYVKPHGADTAVPGFVEGLDLSSDEAALSELAIGREVEIVFRDHRVGRITDLYFRLRT